MTSRLLIVLLLLAPSALAAQAPSSDAPIAVRDRLADVSDTMHLHGIEREFTRAATAAAGLARDRSAASAGVSAGLAALRLWEVTGARAHARRSRDYFDRAARNDPANAWAHYGHALSLEAEMDQDPSRIVTHVNALRDLGLDPVSRARRALERAVSLDPTLPGATELLARYAIETRDEGGLLQARTSFQMSVAGTHSASGLLGVAMTARELGDYAGAADAARRAVEADYLSATAHLSLAKSLALIADSLSPAGIAYENALRLADSTMLRQLWEEASLLHTHRDSAAWRMAEPEARHVVLRAFWDIRGALSGLTAGERAAEHYRRIAIARRDYARRGMYGAAPSNAMRLHKVSDSFDDRGVIFVRHGSPERTHGEPPLQGYITWFYTDESGDPLSYHFYKSNEGGSSKDYLLMHNLPCAIDPIRAAYDPRLTPLTRYRCDPLVTRSVSALINRDAERALRTDSHQPMFDAPLPFHFDWYTFRDGAATELLMAVGIPLSQLPADLRSVRVRLSVVDTVQRAIAHVAREAAPIARSAATIERGTIMRTHLAMSSAAGSRAFRIDVRDADNVRVGTIYGGDIELPDYSGDTLMVSDVMLAEQSDSGSVRRGDRNLALAPTQVFGNGRFRVYYEIYNMPANTPYVTELTVEPLRRGGLRDGIRRLFTGEDRVQLRFEDSAPEDAAGTLPVVHDITAPFREGAWLLRLTVITGSGSITRERRFTLEERN